MRCLNDRIAKKLAKRLEKEAKLAMKAVKTPSGTSTPSEKKAKAEKKKEEEEVPFVNTTPKGEKKGACYYPFRRRRNAY